jgi:hypothetical protein
MIAKALEKGFPFRGTNRRDTSTAASSPVLALDSAQTMRLTIQRARKFRALSTLFTLEVSGYEEAIEELLTPCEVFVDCPVARGVTQGAGAEALAWVRNVGNVSGLYAEHVRLFGGADLRRQMPEVAASGGLYAEAGPQEADAELQGLYDLSGFTTRSDCPCPSYIANELEFMAFLLERAGSGQADALETARNFIVSYLYTWGIVFSAATHARSTHPVTRFAGLMLEHMLFCETQHARAHDLSYGPLGEAQIA